MKFVTLAAVAAAAFVSSAASANGVSGFRAEAIAGWDQIRVSGEGNGSGFAYGAGVGYDLPLGETMSVGVDAELAGSTAKLRESLRGEFIEVNSGRDIYVGGRLTGKVADNVAVYAKAGYSNARMTTKSNIAGFDGLSGNADGFRVGAGAQYLLGNGAYVGGEYRYSNYEGDFSRNQVVATLGYRF